MFKDYIGPPLLRVGLLANSVELFLKRGDYVQREGGYESNNDSWWSLMECRKVKTGSVIMYIAYNTSNKKIIAIRETEWQCRMNAKDIDLVAYNAWVTSITDSEGIVTYPSSHLQ